MNTGNGSWLGLGALLVGIFAVPATAIVNSVYIKKSRELTFFVICLKCFLVAAITPLVFIILMMFN